MDTVSEAEPGAVPPIGRPQPLPWACPGCSAYDLHRSRPATGFQRLLQCASPLVLYRCHDCLRQGWRLSLVASGGEAEEPGTAQQRRPMVLAAAVAAGVTTLLAVAVGVVSARETASPAPIAAPPAAERTSAQPRAAGEGPWGPLRWGMSPQEARRALRPLNGTLDARGTVAPGAEIAGRPYAVSLRFGAGDVLAGVDLTCASSADELRAAYDEALAWLRERHGPPSTSRDETRPPGSWTRTATWTTADGQVTLHGWDTLLEAARGLKLALDGERPAPYGLRIGYLPPAGGGAPRRVR
jgi:hypothetical protein